MFPPVLHTSEDLVADDNDDFGFPWYAGEVAAEEYETALDHAGDLCWLLTCNW